MAKETSESTGLVHISMKTFHFSLMSSFPTPWTPSSQKQSHYPKELLLRKSLKHFDSPLSVQSPHILSGHCAAHTSQPANRAVFIGTLNFEFLPFCPGLSGNPRPGPVLDYVYFLPVLCGHYHGREPHSHSARGHSTSVVSNLGWAFGSAHHSSLTTPKKLSTAISVPKHFILGRRLHRTQGHQALISQAPVLVLL